jgi:hypothetical protein
LIVKRYYLAERSETRLTSRVPLANNPNNNANNNNNNNNNNNVNIDFYFTV